MLSGILALFGGLIGGIISLIVYALTLLFLAFMVCAIPLIFAAIIVVFFILLIGLGIMETYYAIKKRVINLFSRRKK